MKLATQGHSSSFIVQSVTGQRGVEYRHIILLALSLKFPIEVATQIAKNCRRQPPHSHLTPRQQEPLRISAYTLYFQKLESLAYIFVAACMGLSLFKFVQLALKTHRFCAGWRFGRSRSFRVIQGR